MTEALAARRAEPDAPFVRDLLAGLGRTPKALPSKYFYDVEGSRLFDRICELPEYYPTRTELALLRRHAGEIARLMGEAAELVEFGAGSVVKVRLLLEALARPAGYLPIDISGEHLHEAAAALREDHPDLTVRPLVADYTRAFVLPAPPPGTRRRIGFFPGSTIGNFTEAEALAFLQQTAALLPGGGLLIGADLAKDPAVLHAAYNDTAGVTAAFNRNLLVRANREAGADFDLARFAHYAPYDLARRRIDMYLVSLAAQTVRVAGREIAFAEGEAIHTEHSHKYTAEGFQALARRAGFRPAAPWIDPDGLFSLHWLETA